MTEAGERAKDDEGEEAVELAAVGIPDSGGDAAATTAAAAASDEEDDDEEDEGSACEASSEVERKSEAMASAAVCVDSLKERREGCGCACDRDRGSGSVSACIV